MSFSSDVKGELARIEVEKNCDKLAEISGFLKVAGSLRLAGRGQFALVASTENPAIARHYKMLIKEYFDVNAKLEMSSSQKPGSTGSNYRYSLRINPEDKSMQILRETGMLMIKQGSDVISDGINFGILRTKCCKKAFIRGMFLGCGTITNPQRSYHMEFVVTRKQVANDFKKLIGSFSDLGANVTMRKEDYVVYIKKAAYIFDLLNIMGATSALFKFDEIKTNKENRGAATRLANWDNANMDRAIAAAEEQIRYIHIIEEQVGLDNISQQLREVAEIRLARPDAGLGEIGEMLTPPIKKPGVSKRFAKIKELALKLQEGEEQ